MSFPNAIHTVKESIKPAVSRFNPAYLKTPSPFPQRPLAPNRFHPPRGEKQIYLPNFVLALIRPSPFLPANYASFMVPLWLNKLDLKDYLYNLYNLRCLSIRSYIIQSKIAEKGLRGRRQWYRPQSKKKMTVELVDDIHDMDNFVWPEVPDDLSPWGKDGIGEKVKRVEEGWRDREGRSKKWPMEFGSLRRRAQRLLRERREENIVGEEVVEGGEGGQRQTQEEGSRLSGSIIQ